MPEFLVLLILVQRTSGLSCSLSFCLHKGTGCFSQAAAHARTPPSPGDSPVSVLGCSFSPGPQPQHLAANHPLMSTLVLRCGEPRRLHKLGRASRYPNELAGSSSGDPPFSRDHRLCPLGCTTGSALSFPSCHHLQLRAQSCCSIPCLNTDAMAGGISGCQT